MARKIEEQLIEAIREGKAFSGGNTVIRKDGNAWIAELHGNYIAEWGPDGTFFTWAGWITPTTRSRLNAIAEGLGFGCPFSMKNGYGFVQDRICELSQMIVYTAEELGLTTRATV